MDCPRCGCPNSRIQKCSDCRDNYNVCLDCGFEYTKSSVESIAFERRFDKVLAHLFNDNHEVCCRQPEVCDVMMVHLVSDDHDVRCSKLEVCDVADRYLELPFDVC